MAREFDLRTEASSGTTVAAERRAELHAAAEAASARPGGHDVQIVSFDASTGNPAVVVSRDAPAADGDFVRRALAHVQNVGPALGLAPEQAPEYLADPGYQTTSADGVAVHLRQQYKGIAIYDASETVRFDPSGQLLEVAGRSYTIADDLVVEPSIPASEALEVAAAHLAAGDDEVEPDPFGQSVAEPVPDVQSMTARLITSPLERPDRATVFEATGFARPVTVALMWFPLDGGLRLSWHLRVQVPGAPEYRFLIDAADARILLCRRLTHGLGGHAQVVLRSGEGRKDVDFPLPLATYGVPVPPGLPAGFPDPWLLDETTAGASVRAIDFSTGRTVKGAPSAGGVVFAAPAQENAPEQLVLNVFSYCAAMHDALYLLGFREPDGNFQLSALGRGGRAGDAVLAQVHPGVVWGTANMATPADGSAPTMNMGLVNSTQRHTALDADVVYHEYTHGLSNRLVGGPLDDTSLDAAQSSGMGEGWSDFVACSLLGKKVVGDWVVDRATGIRRHAYTEDYPGTYAELGSPQYTKVHDIGELWCAGLMSLGRRLGRTETLQIVVDSLKLTAANPSLLAARDAILLAARQFSVARGDDDGATASFVQSAWEVFARYGMGPGARTDGPQLSGIVADFEPPPAPSTSILRAEAAPGLTIPDADAEGVVSTVSLPAAGVVQSLAVDVVITHPFRGDLVVSLVAPDGRTAVLHNRTGGGADNLQRSYDSDSVALLAALVGTQTGGSWSLQVADRAPADVGRLDSWALAVGIAPVGPSVQLQSLLGAPIPAEGPALENKVTVSEAGTVAGVALAVDIAHAQVGDLGVALRGPTGKRVTVHRRGGAEVDHLITTYRSDAGEPLAAFVGLDAQGDWTLTVVDKAGRDVGKLNSWTLTVQL
ncbi:M36 family metallopeptidase [Kribbella sp. NBC_01510]|uniref:M36 family metallopeptidase n=1 Tax=Kribbella sp. NBC_01510 TaxID=2903581 RepID=UPI003868A978